MKIVVFVKQVPDSTATLSVEIGRVNWGNAPLVINPWDEFAVEAALLQKESLGGDVIAVSLAAFILVEFEKWARRKLSVSSV